MDRVLLRRSLLYVPGSSPKMIARAFDVPADGIIFDLEDAVAPPEKECARAAVATALDAPRDGRKEILVRVNAVTSPLGLRDLLAVVPKRPDTIVVPKADAVSILAADVVIGALEQELGLPPGTIGLVPLMETAASIVDAAAIVAAASRVTGLQFGAEDLTKELGIARTTVGDELHHARSTLVFAGRARGISIIDTPFVHHADPAALVAETERVKGLGMTGKTCIHPNQVAAVNAVFTPTDDEVAQARRVVAAFAEATAAGKGACSLDGKMIDPPVAERARKLLDKADRIAGGRAPATN
ncbi:MAG: CoA ester lyase [Rhodoplanes sp.]|uniref:HpcH/HpaI aldolase/citrate lyase family protein n=1 Tax=Rhodoplanes sp. TaxID=1968906 RepID=UPI0018167699|nr:CoA ester lyase [Rhodoplanes sp.]NVO14387.1 CoA ester lyase [Rhodoplanes sp.]